MSTSASILSVTNLMWKSTGLGSGDTLALPMSHSEEEYFFACLYKICIITASTGKTYFVITIKQELAGI